MLSVPRRIVVGLSRDCPSTAKMADDEEVPTDAPAEEPEAEEEAVAVEETPMDTETALKIVLKNALIGGLFRLVCPLQDAMAERRRRSTSLALARSLVSCGLLGTATALHCVQLKASSAVHAVRGASKGQRASTAELKHPCTGESRGRRS